MSICVSFTHNRLVCCAESFVDVLACIKSELKEIATVSSKYNNLKSGLRQIPIQKGNNHI